MQLEKIKQLVELKKNLVFGPKANSKGDSGNYLGMPYIEISVKDKTIQFTTDTSDYTMGRKLELALEQLFAEFGVTDYNILVHIHKGIWHDKDIILKLHDIRGIQDSDEMAEIIKFVMDNFYKNDLWDFNGADEWYKTLHS